MMMISFWGILHGIDGIHFLLFSGLKIIIFYKIWGDIWYIHVGRFYYYILLVTSFFFKKIDVYLHVLCMIQQHYICDRNVISSYSTVNSILHTFVQGQDVNDDLDSCYRCPFPKDVSPFEINWCSSTIWNCWK